MLTTLLSPFMNSANQHDRTPFASCAALVVQVRYKNVGRHFYVELVVLSHLLPDITRLDMVFSFKKMQLKYMLNWKNRKNYLGKQVWLGTTVKFACFNFHLEDFKQIRVG